MIDSLEGQQLTQKVGLDAEILPPDLPLKFFRLQGSDRHILPLFSLFIASDNLVVAGVFWVKFFCLVPVFSVHIGFGRYDDSIV